MPLYLFVYGTLRLGEPSAFAQRLANEAQFAGAATVKGKLYSLPRYPAMVPGDDGMVRGDLFENVAEDLLGDLDRYEGSEYLRQKMQAQRANGKFVEVWTYIFVMPVERLSVIASGDWLEHKLGLNDKAFGS